MKKPQLKFWQIWNMNFGFLGIQFGFALQNANVSRIFETLGAKIDQIPILWLAAPITGLIIQPIIGHMSDKTWGKLGRRRPYFLVGAILASLALIFMPHSPVLWVAAGMLWILDASINISMEPFRAFVGDLLPDEQRTAGFTMQSFFIGIGAVIASILPFILTKWLHVENTAPEGKIPPSVIYSFIIGAIVFISAVLLTVLTTKEYPPEQMEAFEEERKKEQNIETKDKSLDANFSVRESKKEMIIGIILLLVGIAITSWLFLIKASGEVFVFGIALIFFGILELINSLLLKKNKFRNGFSEILIDFSNMPKTMWQLAIVQFFSWFALFSMWIYSTPAISETVFGTLDVLSETYQGGANWVGVLFGVYNGTAALWAFFVLWIAKKTNRKITHSMALLIGAISFASIFIIKNQFILLIPFVGIGLVWASILSMPYAILTGALPEEKMGTYMGIFNFFIVIPQILAGSVLGFLVKTVFHEHAINAFILGGVSLLIAAITVMFVYDPKKNIKQI